VPHHIWASFTSASPVKEEIIFINMKSAFNL